MWAYVGELQALGNGTATILARLQELGEVAKVMGPALNWGFINRIAAKIRASHRPHLASLAGRWTKPVGDLLWVSADGSPMIEIAIYDRIRARTKAAFGAALNPHLFRDAALFGEENKP